MPAQPVPDATSGKQREDQETEAMLADIHDAWDGMVDDAAALLPWAVELLSDYDLCVRVCYGDVHFAFQLGMALGELDDEDA